MKRLSKLGSVSVILTGLASSFILSSAAVPLAASAATPAPQFTKCTDYFFYGVRGSGQNSKAVMQDGKWSGYGPQVKAVAQKVETGLKAKNKKATIFFGYSDYPAPSVNFSNMLNGPYSRSVFNGANNTVRDLQAINKKCPSTKIILAGYSQGAHVLHGTSYYLSQDKRLAKVRDKVVNVSLISDPARMNGDPVIKAVTIYAGLVKHGTLYDKKAPMQLTKTMAGKVYSYCNVGDIVCNNNGTNIFTHKIHTNYYQQGSPAGMVANRILTAVK